MALAVVAEIPASWSYYYYRVVVVASAQILGVDEDGFLRVDAHNLALHDAELRRDHAFDADGCDHVSSELRDGEENFSPSFWSDLYS